jgi:predicted nucleotidyltransferase
VRIRSNTGINGHTILEIRDFLREIEHFGFGNAVGRRLGADTDRNAETIRCMVREGYLVAGTAETGNAGRGEWRVTELGRQLAVAKATKPMSRTVANKEYAELISRIGHISADDQYLYEVERLYVFGSFIRDTAECGDIDVCIELRPKAKFNEGSTSRQVSNSLRTKISAQFETEGPPTADLMTELFWSEKKVMKELKKRRPRISIMGVSDLQNTEFEFKIGYEAQNAAPLDWERLRGRPLPEGLDLASLGDESVAMEK